MLEHMHFANGVHLQKHWMAVLTEESQYRLHVQIVKEFFKTESVFVTWVTQMCQEQ